MGDEGGRGVFNKGDIVPAGIATRRDIGDIPQMLEEGVIEWCDKDGNILKPKKEKSIFSKAFFMLGFPDETYSQIADTINYAIDLKKIGLDDIAFFPVMPFPGTEISNITGKVVYQGAIIDHIYIYERSFAADRLKKYSAKPEISLNSNFTPDQLRFLVKFAYNRFITEKRVINLEEEFKKYLTEEEDNIYAI